MQIMIAYYSKTGNTEKLANMIAEGVRGESGVDCICKPIEEVTADDLLNSQVIIVGSPTYYGSMAGEVKDFFDRTLAIREELENRVGAAFATSAAPSGGKETTMLSILQAMLISGMIVVGDPLEAVGTYGVACAGAPDDKTAGNAHLLGRRVAVLSKQLALK